MVTIDHLKALATDYEGTTNVRPIFVVMMVQNPNKVAVSENGRVLDFPDLGETEYVGFFYDLDVAVSAVRSNACDIREDGCFNAAFILLRHPGIYDYATANSRLYFVWDNATRCFVQAEEPVLFAHSAL